MYRAQEMELRQRAKQTLTLEAAALTQQGERRPANQDVVFHRSGRAEAGLSAGLYMVCDGLGGLQMGEVASRLAVDTVAAELRGLFPDGASALGQGRTPLPSSLLDEWIRLATVTANIRIRRHAESHWHQAGNLGTTITLVLIYGSTAHVANVGDSRTYAVRAGRVTQVTRDHSMAAKLAEVGLIDKCEIGAHPQRNVLYQALGPHETVEVDLFQWKLAPNDKLLLCSDGLWTAFPDNVELARWLSWPTTPDDLCRQLVNEAIRRDGADDISAVVVTVS